MSVLPVLDPKPLQDLFDLGGSPGLIQELIALFQEDVPVRLAMLRTALASADGELAMMEAHQLKGALGNLGLVRFADLASRLEILARAGHLEADPGLAESLSAAYDDALRALNATFPEA